MFCPHCGNETELVIGGGPATVEAVSAEVEIARINAERDVAVAKITARQDTNWNETRVAVAEIETDATVAAAAVEGELIAAAVESGPGDQAPAVEPIVIDAPELPDAEPDDAPPPADDAPEPSAPGKARGLGMW